MFRPLHFLASIGVGGFYLYTTSILPDEEITTIKGPYPRPFNPYEGHRLHFFTAETKYHLQSPSGSILPEDPFEV